MSDQLQSYVNFLEQNYLTLEEKQARIELELEKGREALELFEEAKEHFKKIKEQQATEEFEKLLEDEDFYKEEE